MTHIGIDIEQFVRDPHRSGIQRVLQNLARMWPEDHARASFVVPFQGEHLLLEPQQAADMFDQVFSSRSTESLRECVTDFIESIAPRVPQVGQGQLVSLFTSWLLPEVSYLPSVLDRFELLTQLMPASMVAYDILPMTEPDNYRFRPGTSGHVSRYFRQLALADAIVCISNHTQAEVWNRLRRDRALVSVVAHPGGDHIRNSGTWGPREPGPVRFLRLGTLEARKMPCEIAAAFAAARGRGVDAELVFVGSGSASSATINDEIEAGVKAGIGMRWIADADDEEILAAMAQADFFLSIGVEGYGIPVLESLRLGTPVLFAGVQPAAELMQGSGAFPLTGVTDDALIAAFTTFGNLQTSREAATAVDPDAVPSWQEFARVVACTARDA